MTTKIGYYLVASAGGEVLDSGTPVVIYTINIPAAGTAALYDGTSTGDTLVVSKEATSDGTVFNFPNGIVFPNGCYADGDDLVVGYKVV
jgi:hypothetical protein